MLNRSTCLVVLAILGLVILLAGVAGVFFSGSQRVAVSTGPRTEVSQPAKTPPPASVQGTPRPPQSVAPQGGGLTQPPVSGGDFWGNLTRGLAPDLGPLGLLTGLTGALIDPGKIVREALWSWINYQFWAGILIGLVMILNGERLDFDLSPRWLIAAGFSPGTVFGVFAAFLGVAAITWLYQRSQR